MKHIQTYESFINESVKSFAYSEAKEELDGDIDSIKKEANDFLDFLKREKYSWSGVGFMYFPNFTWAGGKQQFGPSIGILVGSDIIYVRPIQSEKVIKVQDALLAKLIQRGDIESYRINF